jgi:hypothetical protein
MHDYLDLRVCGETKCRVRQTYRYSALTWNIPDAPDDFVIVMQNWNNGQDQTFTTGNGITKSGDNIIWNAGLINQEKGLYHGKITSVEKEFGIAFENDIIISVE